MFSMTAVLYFGLSLNDFKDGWYSWIFAVASFITNYFQTMVVDQIALQRYLNYLNILGVTIKEGGKDIQKLLHVSEIKEPKMKWLIAQKMSFNFSSSSAELWALYFISIVPASLAREVDWLDDPRFEHILHLTTMLMLEPSLHDRMQNIRMPSLTHAMMLNDEIKKCRLVLDEILCENCWDAENDVDLPQSKHYYRTFKQTAMKIVIHCSHMHWP